MNMNQGTIQQQLQQCGQMIGQLIQQTQQASQLYQQMLQQEQQNAMQLEQLAHREQQAVQMIQHALQGHQTAMQQMQHVVSICHQLEHGMQSSITGMTSPSEHYGAQAPMSGGTMHSMNTGNQNRSFQ
ncbi:hypothetical protein [Paenibacillus abyssi]|uniref:AMP-dependent synthetase and ligase n=1 Tax=Paenibacillus abyssi TaxID=1340531 RepID=A0A917G5G1_9BACL|nr:hypothetical protein [Paenibacillus abyssi]GGG23248.1 hypothetical protein GCM10010916_44780 [Paenibacillus abyssi]